MSTPAASRLDAIEVSNKASGGVVGQSLSVDEQDSVRRPVVQGVVRRNDQIGHLVIKVWRRCQPVIDVARPASLDQYPSTIGEEAIEVGVDGDRFAATHGYDRASPDELARGAPANPPLRIHLFHKLRPDTKADDLTSDHLLLVTPVLYSVRSRNTLPK